MLLDADDPSRVIARTARAAPGARDRRRASRHRPERRLPDRDRRGRRRALRVLRHGRLQDRRRAARPREDHTMTRTLRRHRRRRLSWRCSPRWLVVGPTTSTRGGRRPLTNLAHLDFLGTTVTPPAQPRPHDVPARAEPDSACSGPTPTAATTGTTTVIGGGAYDAATNTWAQGAFNADDITRAAVVYLRHWQQTGDDDQPRARRTTCCARSPTCRPATGPNAGNVVLWMQPDGTLNPQRRSRRSCRTRPTAAESYWLARTVWALGEGYAAFRHADPAFAAFLRQRLDLAIARRPAPGARRATARYRGHRRRCGRRPG